MANKVLLKKSSTGAKVPLVTDLDYGELAINYADGKLYYKTSSNTIKSFTEDSSVATLTGTQTLSNKTLSSVVLTGTLTVAGGVGTAGQVLQSTGSGVQWADVSGGGGGSGYAGLVEVNQSAISSSTTINTVSATTYRGAKYTIQITNSTAYALYEFFVMHDGTSIYFPYSSNAYAGDSGGNYQNYFHGDYLDSIATTKIQVGNTYHALNWAVTGGNLVFSASCSSGTISVKGAVLLIKA
jgi:hypothetical protein